MKKILRFAVLSLALAALGSCDDDMTYVTPMEVTPNNIAGTWYLAEWKGEALPEGLYNYIDLIRKDTRYKMYQNVDSFSPRLVEGRYAIYTDEELGAIIRGEYDNGAGDWQHRYIVTDLDETSMVWTAKDDATDISVYKRCNGIPEEITGGKTADDTTGE